MDLPASHDSPGTEPSGDVSPTFRSDRQRGLPPLRLHHLFALTAVMAVMLSIGGRHERPEVPGFELPRLLEIAMIALHLLHTVISSIAITMAAYGVAWRREGIAFFHHPGHWLLVAIAASSLIYFPLALLGNVLGVADQPPSGIGSTRLWIMSIGFLIPVVFLLMLNIYIGRKHCVEARWRRVFYAKAVTNILPVIGDLILLLFLDRAVRAERPRRVPVQPWTRRGDVPPVTEAGRLQVRDAAHRAGVVLQFAQSAMMLVMFAAMIVMVPMMFFR